MGEEFGLSEDAMGLDPQDRESIKPPEAPKLLTEVEPIKKAEMLLSKEEGRLKISSNFH